MVRRLADSGLCDWEEIDVDADESLRRDYGMDVPVILVNGRKAFKYRTTETALRIRLEREKKREHDTC